MCFPPRPPTDDQIFYLRLLARHLCSRKGIKTLTLADSAGIAGDQKQKENKTQAFLNRFTRGTVAHADYRSFWTGVLKLHLEHERQGVRLFDDPIVAQAFVLVYPDLNPANGKDNSFIDEPLQKWFWIDPERSSDVCRHYSGLWWIVRPSTAPAKPGMEIDFNLSLLNIQPLEVSRTVLPLFKFHQTAGGSSSGGGEVTSHGRLLAFDSDQILLFGKRRGSQTSTQLSWKYNWDPDRRKRETVIRGAIFTANTLGVLIQSYFHGCFIEGTDRVQGAEFEEVDSFLRGYLDTTTEAELADVPTSIAEVHELRLLEAIPDGRQAGLSALTGKRPPHRAIVPPAGLERLKASPGQGPILTIV